ncbi:MAG: 30S ribosomal protein S20 [Syntrophomonadaceae bacterium]|nr:30S ribosomal protein S20 [Syntrophomonadaceae bacterium]
MAYSKTPAKRARNAEKRRISNKARNSEMKTAIKKFETSVLGDDVDTAREQLIHASSLIDKSVSKGGLHKNTAARKKSSLAKKFNAMV